MVAKIFCKLSEKRMIEAYVKCVENDYSKEAIRFRRYNFSGETS